jgi:hypothetical protein
MSTFGQGTDARSRTKAEVERAAKLLANQIGSLQAPCDASQIARATLDN